MLTSVIMAPHGPEIVPVAGRPHPEPFHRLHEALLDAGKAVASQKTDLLIVLSPHSYALADDYLLFLSERYQNLIYDLSESNIFGDIASRTLWPAERSAAEKLLAMLVAQGLPVQGIMHGTFTFPITLGWGEGVPLHYLAPEGQPRSVVITLPRKRLTGLDEMQSDLMRMGEVFLSFADVYPGNVSIVISADLAHAHQASGSYGFHESAPVFDSLAKEWVASPSEEKLVQMLPLAGTARVCGMAGMRVAQTIFNARPMTCRQLVYECPTYYGMLMARWE